MQHSFRLSQIAVLAAACSISFSAAAHDTGKNNNPPSSTQPAGNSSTAAASASAMALAAQGQQQGQIQGQKQNSTSISRNANKNSNISAGGTSAARSGDVSSNPNQSTVVEGDHDEAAKIPVQSAYSAGLVASNGTCMGSSSGGATGPGFSATFGTTWKDSDCSRRYTAEALKAAGRTNAAFGVLCQIPDVKAATPRECAAVESALGVQRAEVDQIQQVIAQREEAARKQPMPWQAGG